MTVLCRAFGLLTRTELPIPGALPVVELLDGTTAAPVPAAELSVQYGKTSLTAERSSLGPYRAGHEGLLFEKEGVARFLCSWKGASIQVEALGDVGTGEIAEYLIATALPAGLWLRGEIMLHAGATVLPGKDGAVALLGASGSGKSTLLHALMGAGAEILAEDSLCLRGGPNTFEGSGLPGCLHVRTPGAPLAADRQKVAVPASQSRSSAALRSIVLLEPKSAGETTCSKMAPAEAMAALLRHRHRPRVPELAGLSPGLLPRWGDIARAVPVYSLKFAGLALGATDNESVLRALEAL